MAMVAICPSKRSAKKVAKDLQAFGSEVLSEVKRFGTRIIVIGPHEPITKEKLGSLFLFGPGEKTHDGRDWSMVRGAYSAKRRVILIGEELLDESRQSGRSVVRHEFAHAYEDAWTTKRRRKFPLGVELWYRFEKTRNGFISHYASTKPAEAGAAPASQGASAAASTGRKEERVKMTRLRQTIAKRLKEAQNSAAMLTTFNDVDMTAVIEARAKYKDLFEKKHGVRLGFMGFFVKAATMALKDIPSVNASIEGDEIVYHDYADISVAVSAPNGLVVPVIRDAQALSVAGIEKTIGDFGKRAKDGTLKMDEMKGGTFTISNGGVFGSLMSTPIINPPQSAVLGLHRIEERPVVRDGQVVVRPMMYLALSYDHRLIDGREAVTFLVALKNAIEDPTRILIDL